MNNELEMRALLLECQKHLDVEQFNTYEQWERLDARIDAALSRQPSAVREDKCLDCRGSGDKCLAGHSAHPDNWYQCETCRGSGKANQQPNVPAEATDSMIQAFSDVAWVEKGLIHGFRDAYRAMLAAAPKPEVVATEPMYYLQDTRQFVGNCPMWWCPDGNGYTTRIDLAAKFTRDEAERQHRSRETDVPWPCEQIDAITRPTVDQQEMQRTPKPEDAA